MKKMIIDGNNFPTAFYDTNLNTSIPNDAIDISETDWLEFINNQGTRKWDTILNQIEIFTPIPISLELHKTNCKKIIDNVAEQRRLNYITPGSGQSLTYQEKALEADKYITDGSPVDLTPYPFIQAEVNATGKTAINTSNDILAAQALWITKGALIEEHRIKNKIDIDSSTSVSEIDSIVSNAKTNIELI